MGTYTTNYQLFMPSIGEQGWGTLVNENFSTIDTSMKGLSNNIETLDAEIDAIEERVTILEAGNFETVNVAGTITADGFTGRVGNLESLSVERISSYNTSYMGLPPYTLYLWEAGAVPQTIYSGIPTGGDSRIDAGVSYSLSLLFRYSATASTTINKRLVKGISDDFPSCLTRVVYSNSDNWNAYFAIDGSNIEVTIGGIDGIVTSTNKVSVTLEEINDLLSRPIELSIKNKSTSTVSVNVGLQFVNNTGTTQWGSIVPGYLDDEFIMN